MRKGEENQRWKALLVCEGGHRYFEDKENHGRIGVADRSGFFPDETDDGILYLDREGMIVRTGDPADGYWRIPLVTEAGRKTGTIANMRETDEVRRMFKIEQDFSYAYQYSE